MIARPTDITQTGPTTPDLASAESPMQRQILLWQRELLRRWEAGRRGSLEADQK
jgi:hypothetical protein